MSKRSIARLRRHAARSAAVLRATIADVERGSSPSRLDTDDVTTSLAELFRLLDLNPPVLNIGQVYCLASAFYQRHAFGVAKPAELAIAMHLFDNLRQQLPVLVPRHVQLVLDARDDNLDTRASKHSALMISA
jgi:hypothetical protein